MPLKGRFYMYAPAIDLHWTYKKYCFEFLNLSLNQIRLKWNIYGQFYETMFFNLTYHRNCLNLFWNFNWLTLTLPHKVLTFIN